MSRSNERKKSNSKAAIGSGPFMPMGLSMLKSSNLLGISPHASKLLLDICSQWRYGHNGDVSVTWSLMQPRGWKSKETLNNSLKELREAELIILTRQGGKNLCSLYAVGWIAIDQCRGKLDIPATAVPPIHYDGLLNFKSPATVSVVKFRHIGAISIPA